MLFLPCSSILINIQFYFIILYINVLHRSIAPMFGMHSFFFSFLKFSKTYQIYFAYGEALEACT